MGLTDEELDILDHLKAAWNKFVKLDRKNPADEPDFAAAVHTAQRLVAIRVARRVDPSVWSMFDESWYGLGEKP